MNNPKFLKWSCIFAWIVIIMIAIIIFINIFWPRNPIYPGVSLLKPDKTTHFVLSTDRNERVKYLSNIILQQQSSYDQSSMALESQRMQTRLSFIALFAFLLIPFLTKKKKSNVRVSIVCILGIFFISFYYYDVQTVDHIDRQNYKMQSIFNTVVALSNIKPTDSIRYELDFNRLNKFENFMHAHSFKRKFGYLFRPDLSQISFYFLPFFVLLFLYLFMYYYRPEKVSKVKKRK
jgi:hypothetical protein